MSHLIKSIFSFLSNLLAIALFGSTLALFTGEIRLAALKKASHGSSRLSYFTARMTKAARSNKY